MRNILFSLLMLGVLGGCGEVDSGHRSFDELKSRWDSLDSDFRRMQQYPISKAYNDSMKITVARMTEINKAERIIIKNLYTK